MSLRQSAAACLGSPTAKADDRKQARGALRFISLFAGIGGLDLGLERAGLQCVAQVESDAFCRKVLDKRWPDVPKFTDVRTFTRGTVHGTVDLIAGGPPCQPFSHAGRRRGAADHRNLWPEMLRIVQEWRPTWVLVENVARFAHSYLDTVYADLAGAHYATGAIVLPACAFGLPQIRERVFVLAHADGFGRDAGQVYGRAVAVAPPKAAGEGIRRQQHCGSTGGKRPMPHAGVFRVADGFPTQLDKARLRALGNAVVPQIAEWIGRHLVEVTNG